MAPALFAVADDLNREILRPSDFPTRAAAHARSDRVAGAFARVGLRAQTASFTLGAAPRLDQYKPLVAPAGNPPRAR